MPGYTEADYENSVIELFRNDLGYEYAYGPDIERDFRSPLYDEVLEDSLYRLNRGLPSDAIQDALFKLRNFENGELVQKNAVFMDYLQNGIPVRYFDKGEERSAIVYLVDYKNPDNNHPTSSRHPRMSLYDRAAQFSPFAALTGHDEAVKETARLTDKKIELDDDTKAKLNEKLQIIQDNIGANTTVTFTYFVPDERKSGGKYISCTGIVKKIDEYEHTVILTDKASIPIEQISGIEGELFSDFDIYE